MSPRLTLFLSIGIIWVQRAHNFSKVQRCDCRRWEFLSSDICFSSLYQVCYLPKHSLHSFLECPMGKSKNNMTKNKPIISVPFSYFLYLENEVIYILWIIPHLNIQLVIKSYVSYFLNIHLFMSQFSWMGFNSIYCCHSLAFHLSPDS